MKHSPGPWTALETGLILDGNGAVVVRRWQEDFQVVSRAMQERLDKCEEVA